MFSNITLVAGARPNFMKIAPIIDAIKKNASDIISFKLIHTGQHYDKNMSERFFEQLSLPYPDVILSISGTTQAEQTASIMIGFEKFLLSNPTDLVLVVGDVTSTMACAIVAQKLGIKVAHIEAGIRSGDWKMPEEINRLITDAITNFFFTTTENATENLLKSGVSSEKIFFVGNTMIDTLLKNRVNFTPPDFWTEISLSPKKYFVITFHRPSNVDDPQNLKSILDHILENTADLLVVFPVHPRTKKVLEALNYTHPKLYLTQPLGYFEFNYLVDNSIAVITDSGGITEETTVLGIPCLTLRDTTERPETVEIGTNELIGNDPKNLEKYLKILFNGNWKKGLVPTYWDGKTGERIVDVLLKLN